MSVDSINLRECVCPIFQGEETANARLVVSKKEECRCDGEKDLGNGKAVTSHAEI